MNVPQNTQGPLRPVQELNYALLLTVRLVADTNMATASAQFGLSVAQLELIRGLNPADVLRIVGSLGDEALFAPREDLDTILATPQSILPFVAASRKRVPTKIGPVAGH